MLARNTGSRSCSNSCSNGEAAPTRRCSWPGPLRAAVSPQIASAASSGGDSLPALEMDRFYPPGLARRRPFPRIGSMFVYLHGVGRREDSPRGANRVPRAVADGSALGRPFARARSMFACIHGIGRCRGVRYADAVRYGRSMLVYVHGNGRCGASRYADAVRYGRSMLVYVHGNGRCGGVPLRRRRFRTGDPCLYAYMERLLRRRPATPTPFPYERSMLVCVHGNGRCGGVPLSRRRFPYGRSMLVYVHGNGRCGASR